MLEEKVALIEDQVVNIDILFDVKVFHVKRALVFQVGPMSYISSRFLPPSMVSSIKMCPFLTYPTFMHSSWHVKIDTSLS